MRITYARVWMCLIRIESELAGFAFNALLNSHSCRQAFRLLKNGIATVMHTLLRYMIQISIILYIAT